MKTFEITPKTRRYKWFTLESLLGTKEYSDEESVEIKCDFDLTVLIETDMRHFIPCHFDSWTGFLYASSLRRGPEMKFKDVAHPCYPGTENETVICSAGKVDSILMTIWQMPEHKDGEEYSYIPIHEAMKFVIGMYKGCNTGIYRFMILRKYNP